MRVISGMAKGRRLEAPAGMHTRPVTDQIKEALFSIWQMQIYGANFLDVFAGSGGVGIEAMSRGAAKTVFIDNDREAINVINRNISNCKMDAKYEVCFDDVFSRVKKMENGEKFDIIYLDPPYTVDEIIIPSLEAVSSPSLLNEDGLITIRTPREKQMPDELEFVYKARTKIYGISAVHFYKLK